MSGSLNIEEGKSTVSDSDVETTILGFFLPDIIKQYESRGLNNKNVFKLIDDEEYKTKQLPQNEILTELVGSKSEAQLNKLPALTNILTRKDEDINICQLPLLTYDSDIEKNALFLNQAVPYIRLYKTFQRPNGEKIELEIPFDIVGNHLSNTTDEDYEKEFEKRLLDGGSGGSVGITNFKWVSEGKNEGNNSMFSVSFTIFIQNVSELTRERNRKVVGVEEDQEKEQSFDEVLTVSILDLLYPAFTQEGGKFKFKDLPEGFDPARMALKAEVGYNYPKELMPDISDNFFKTVLFLHLYKHNFVFKDDGSIELTINYIGNIESTLSDKIKSDILRSPGETRIIKAIELLEEWTIVPGKRKDIEIQLEKDFYDFSQIRLFLGSARPDDSLPLGPEDLGSSFKEEPEVYRLSALKKLRKELANIRVNTFLEIFNILREEKKIFGIRLNRENFEALKEVVTFKQIDDQALASIREKIKSTNAELEQIQTPSKTSLWKWVKSLPGDIKNIFSNDIQLDTEELIEELDDNFKREQDKVIKYFVSLEDLIQVFISYYNFGGIDVFGSGRGLSTLKQNYDIHLSSFTYINYQTYDELREDERTNYVIEKDKKIYNTRGLKREIGSLGHIPISIDSLSNFYNEKIVKTEETSYSFNNFLKDIFTRLIPESISSISTPNAPRQKVLTNRMFFESPAEQFTITSTSESIPTYFEEMSRGFITFDNFSKLYRSRFESLDKKTTRVNLCFISSAENNMERFSGDKNEDCKRNILHFYVNNNKGILKEAVFSRDDNQKLETANLLAANDAGPNKIIRQVYHCKLNLFGNSFFEPGQLIYISPNYPGSNLSIDALFKIGLGGYYRILKIDNSISPGSFDTQLDCRWEMFGDEAAKNPFE